MTIELQKRILDYWNTQPCNVGHSSAPIGSEQYFTEVTDKRYRAEPHILDFAGFHQWRGKRVLEIGCGIGTDAEQFARHGAEYVGIDLSDASLDLCKQRFSVYNLDGEFHHIDITDDKVSDLGQFDLVYSYGVLHHYPGMQDHIKTVSTLLSPGGEFRFMVYAKNSWKYAMIRKGLDQFEAQANCPYAEAYTAEEIHELIKDEFELLRLRQSHCFMYNVDKYKQGIFELEPWFEAMPELMREAVKEYLGWHLLVKARKL